MLYERIAGAYFRLGRGSGNTCLSKCYLAWELKDKWVKEGSSVSDTRKNEDPRAGRRLKNRRGWKKSVDKRERGGWVEYIVGSSHRVFGGSKDVTYSPRCRTLTSYLQNGYRESRVAAQGQIRWLLQSSSRKEIVAGLRWLQGRHKRSK